MKIEETIATAAEGPKTGSAKTKKATGARKTAKPATKKSSKAGSKTVSKRAKKETARPAAGIGEGRTDTKKAIVLELLRRKEGATTAEIAKATDWQNHSIRGFISGHVTKKMGLAVGSSKNEAGERTYRIEK
jgi:predicted HTH transcriptional regulator